MLEERFNKQTKLSEDLSFDKSKDIETLKATNKKLQEFFDKYDNILQDERNQSTK